jgi:protein involved in polysaccharide export with SLBB domain
MVRSGFLSLFIVLCCCACSPEPVKRAAPGASAPGRPTPASVAAAANALDASVYKLAAGDVVHIEVLGETELTLSVQIDPLGTISYPFLGQVPAAGLTLRQLESRIYTGLKSGYLKSPDVRAAIQAYRPIYVSGQVRQTGAYPFSLGLTVEKAVTLAGGMTQFASTGRIYVQHAGAAQDQREKVELDTPVLPGDTIVVEERLF